MFWKRVRREWFHERIPGWRDRKKYRRRDSKLHLRQLDYELEADGVTERYAVVINGNDSSKYKVDLSESEWQYARADKWPDMGAFTDHLRTQSRVTGDRDVVLGISPPDDEYRKQIYG